jgi:hypothetical protein
MYEIAGARQPEIPSSRQGYRRLFANEEFTLHVWYARRGGEMTEFHLFYGHRRDRLVSWYGDRDSLCDGWVTERGFRGTDGPSMQRRLDVERFRAAASSIDPAVRDAVLGWLEGRPLS